MVEEHSTDEEIRQDILTLSTMINQHVLNYYRLHGDVEGVPVAAFLRRRIGLAIINNTIDGDMDGTVRHSHVPPLFILLDSD
jgi:hypothetical protein